MRAINLLVGILVDIPVEEFKMALAHLPSDAKIVNCWATNEVSGLTITSEAFDEHPESIPRYYAKFTKSGIGQVKCHGLYSADDVLRVVINGRPEYNHRLANLESHRP